MFYQVGSLPVTYNLLDNSSDIYLIVYGMIRSDTLIIPGPCVFSISTHEEMLTLRSTVGEISDPRFTFDIT